jgi:electron transfer flavoprotein beta subunit
MPTNIIVCAKQVVDPETPASAFRIDPDAKQVIPAQGVPPVVNGFDENAVEAALQIKDAGADANITVISVGTGFVMDVMKKPLSMGADQLILVDDLEAADLDSFASASVLTEAIKKAGEYDLILCGRQASDWDNGMVPLGVAEMLGIPCITLAQKIELTEDGVSVQRAMPDGYEVVESSLPAVITVSNELGEPRYPTLRGIMQASRKAPTVWSASDLGLSEDQLAKKLELAELFVPVSDLECEFVEGEDEADAGRQLALKLREARLI